MNDASVGSPVHLDTSMMSKESLMSDLTAKSWGSTRSGADGDGAKVNRVDGFELVFVRAVFGGRVTKRR